MQPLRRRRVLVLVLGIIALLVILLFSVKEDPKIRLSLQAPVAPTVSLISSTVTGMATVGELTNATYQGQSVSGQSWRVQASLAQQIGSTASATVALTSTTAAWFANGATAAEQAFTLAAPSATFSQRTQNLELPAGVTLQGPLAGGMLTVQAVTGQANLSSQTTVLQGTLAQPVQVRLMWGPMPAAAPQSSTPSVQSPKAP